MTRTNRIASIVGVSLYLAVVLLVLLAFRRIRLPLRGLARWARGDNPLRPATPHAAAARLEAPAGAATAPLRRDDLLRLLRCATCGGALEPRGEALACSSGHRTPVRGGVPRFVRTDAYVGSFSFEWNTYKTHQVDSARGDDLSEKTFLAKTGLGPGDLAGKLVLDAGVGTGRFSEVMARWGASCVGIDLSFAVESAHANLAASPHALVVQADLGRAPFAPGTFDVIVSIGVLHHTPDTRRFFRRLVPLLKPGGTIAIWVYPDADAFVTRKAWIPFTSRIPPRPFNEWCRWFVPFVNRHATNPLVRGLVRMLPISRQGDEALDILDTFDGFSPRFHGVHSFEEVEGWFREAGLTEVRRMDGYPAAVRGRRPERAAAPGGQ